MRCVFVINSLGAGGAERSLFELLRILGTGRVEAHVVVLGHRAWGVERSALEEDWNISFVGGWTYRSLLQTRSVIRSSRADLVHTALFEADLLGRFAALGLRVPVLTSLVNTPYVPVRRDDPAIQPWKLSAVQLIDGWTARHLTTHFHAITHAVKDAAVSGLGLDPSRITVVERGRDPARLGVPSTERRAAARARLGIPTDAAVLVTVGRQEFQKGQWHLIEAMPKLTASHPDTRLLVAGRTGNASIRLRNVAADLDGQVDFLGHRDDVPEILAAADLFVFPSLYEGLGGALIEAMALGLPIVASDLPAIREVVEAGRNAVLVRPGSSGDLAAAVDALLADDSRRASMSSRSRRIFEKRFTLERSAARMLELFERVAAEGRRRKR